MTGKAIQTGTRSSRSASARPWPTTATSSRLSKKSHPLNTRANPTTTAAEYSSSAAEAVSSGAIERSPALGHQLVLAIRGRVDRPTSEFHLDKNSASVRADTSIAPLGVSSVVTRIVAWVGSTTPRA